MRKSTGQRGVVRRPLAAPPSSTAPRRLPTLDGARGVAALIVVVSHGANLGLLPAELGGGAGQMGVILFFVLSGFLMAYLYADRPFVATECQRYARHRLGRVVPLYLLIVVLSWALTGRQDHVVTFDVGHGAELAKHLLLLHGNGALWTIPVEIHFYVVFVALWYANSRGRPLLGLLITLGGFAAIMVRLVPGRAGFTLSLWAQFFVIGTFAGLVWRRHHHAVTTWVEQRPWLDGIGWLVLIATLAALPGLRGHLHLPTMPNWRDPLTAGMPILFFASALIGIGPFRRLAARPLRWLGDISYGIYLFHWPVLMTVIVGFAPSTRVERLGAFALVVAVTIALAWISNRLFERPVQALVNRR
jgi:peptidoglycan/LPS O-acetylase OafA/YrhL